ncbi:MAG: class II aldolase/adducin family protein [Burkholderiales bacterium]
MSAGPKASSTIYVGGYGHCSQARRTEARRFPWRNHGLLACGRTVPEAFFRHWTLQRACEVPARADAIPGPNILLSLAIHDQIASDRKAFDTSGTLPRTFFDAMIRRMEIARSRQYPDWRR